MKLNGIGKNLKWHIMEIAIWSFKARATSNKTTICLVLQSSQDIQIWTNMLLSQREIHSKDSIPIIPKSTTIMLNCTLLWVPTRAMLPRQKITAMELDTKMSQERDHLLPQPKLEWTSATFSESTTTKRKIQIPLSRCASPKVDFYIHSLFLHTTNMVQSILVKCVSHTMVSGKDKSTLLALSRELPAKRM